MKRTRQAATTSKKAEATLVVNMPVSVHRGLKVRAANVGMTMKQYVLDLLKKDGIS